MTRKNGLPRRVYLKHGRYWYVAPDNTWHGLTRESQGLPAMFRELANKTDAARHGDMMPAVVSRWLEAKIAGGLMRPQMSDPRAILAAIKALAPADQQHLKGLVDWVEEYVKHEHQPA